jgi:hypothetical protein
MLRAEIVGRWTIYSVENRTSNKVVHIYAGFDRWCSLIGGELGSDQAK